MQLQDLWHRYAGAEDWTLQGIDLSLARGELVGLLGPSGCGKTTLLRLIAGFERPVRGRVALDGRDVASASRWLPPERRGVGMVFQDYALFPHLDAWANACFGLRRGQDSSRAAWLMDLLGLADLRRRYPHELSGGQRQRLALARALAPGPSLLLLDEPFSNLDVEVRLRLRSELPAVLARCGTSGLMVTHDPEEALAICDRVAILEAGLLHQCASPQELVQAPATPFVGRFALQRNLLPARREGSRFHTPLGALELQEADRCAAPTGVEPQVLVDAEAIALVPDAQGPCTVLGREFLGHGWLYQVQALERVVRLRLPLAQDYNRGLRCRLQLRPGAAALLYPGPRPLLACIEADSEAR